MPRRHEREIDGLIAAFQMYDWAEVQSRTDAFWAAMKSGLKAAGIECPEHLARPADNHEPWTNPGLLVGQTCGLPYVSGLAGNAVIVGRPCYGLPNASDGQYSSALVCHRDRTGDLTSFEGARVAINDYVSQSGCNALADALLQAGRDHDRVFFKDVQITGAHRMSARMVSQGQADIAAIDAVAWALFQELEPDHFDQLRVVQWTAPTPALPFITSERHSASIDRILAALQSAAAAVAPATGIPRRILAGRDGDYDPIREIAARVKGMRFAPGEPVLGQGI